MAAILTAAVLLLRVPAGASATRSAAQPAGNVAFLSGGFGGLDVVHADGNFPGEMMQLTPPGTPVWAYAWSPRCDNDAEDPGGGGCSIAYIDANDGSLWLAGFGGYGRRLLLAGSTLGSSALSWSPDGREIAITSSGRYVKPSASHGPDAWGWSSLGSCSSRERIYLVPIDGSHPRELRVAASECLAIAWSPRGDEIAYGGRGGVFVIHPDGSGRLLVAPGGWGWVTWSADGTELAFAPSHPPRSGLLYSGIGVVDADGRHFHIVTTKADNEYPAVWSPKGHQLLYGAKHGGGIYVIDANGQNDHRVTTDSPLGSDWGALAWAPDGNSIIYDASQGGLYQVGVNGRGKIQLTSPPTADLDPSWVSPGWYWG
jgi:Tol biopolymer transport system component